MRFDELLSGHLGEFGRYQQFLIALLCIPPIFVAMQSLSWTFTASSLPYRCRISDTEPLNASYWSDSPFLVHTNCSGRNSSSCPYKSCSFADNSACRFGYIYDHSEITYSAINRWDIVCDRSILKAVIQSMYYIGQMAGALLFGYLGDSIGRKKVFFITLSIFILSGSLMAVAPHWALFGLLRGLTGFAHPGIVTIAVIMATELTGPTKRKLGAILSSVFFALGQSLLGTLAYFIRHYQHLQLAISIPSVCIIVFWWLLPESPRWLISKKRFENADRVLRLMARFNKTTLPENWWEQIEDRDSASTSTKKEEKIYGYRDLIKTPAMRSLTLACNFLYFVVAMIYYGIAMKTDFLGGNIYVTFIVGSLIEIPALIVLNCFANRIGRKPIFAGSYLVAALCMLTNLIIPTGAHWSISMLQFLTAKAALSVAYTMVYMVIPEVFPTVIRNTAVGCCSTVARFGTITASYIAMWIVEAVGTWAMILPFGATSLAAALVVIFFIPETARLPLLDTIEEVEERGKRKAKQKKVDRETDTKETRPNGNIESQNNATT